MPLWLKYARATYQLLINKMFTNLIEKTMEMYVDEMLIKKFDNRGPHKHLGEAFQILKRYIMKLCLLQCAFGVTSGKLLGYMTNQRGIEANPKRSKP